jgi:hypothetical protein
MGRPEKSVGSRIDEMIVSSGTSMTSAKLATQDDLPVPGGPHRIVGTLAATATAAADCTMESGDDATPFSLAFFAITPVWQGR